MIVAQAHVDGFSRSPGLGVNAEVGYIAQCYGIDPVELMGVTGTAFRAHFFVPELNPGFDDAPPWTWSSLRHNNYGHCESAAYYYGGEVISVTDRNAVQNWKLLRFEIDAGRPAIVYGLIRSRPAPGDAVLSALVTGYRLENPLAQFLTLADGDELEVTGEALGSAEIVLVRPGPTVSYRSTDAQRRADVFAWAAGHLRAPKELVYETSRFYACGASALRRASAFLLSEPTDEALVFGRAFVEELLRAREAGLIYCGRHAPEVSPAISATLAQLTACCEVFDSDLALSARHLSLAAAAELECGDRLEAAAAA